LRELSPQFMERVDAERERVRSSGM
jgi:hypothetical protein